MLRYTTLIVALAFVAAGCASGGAASPTTATTITDVSMLAGSWTGWVNTSQPSVSTRTMTVIRPDGSFTASALTPGAGDTQGTITVKDGTARYQSMAGRPAGVFFVPTGTMTLSERGGKRVIDGKSDDGKVTFELRASN